MEASFTGLVQGRTVFSVVSVGKIQVISLQNKGGFTRTQIGKVKKENGGILPTLQR